VSSLADRGAKRSKKVPGKCRLSRNMTIHWWKGRCGKGIWRAT
jgi:hypothetical protein